jgi:hypothetical protein
VTTTDVSVQAFGASGNIIAASEQSSGQHQRPSAPRPAKPGMEAGSAARRVSPPSESTAPVHYRAIHTKTSWRKVDRHKSIDAALHGKDGAAALFAGKVRINYDTHGDPKFVLVWQEGAPTGWIVLPDPAWPRHVDMVEVPTRALMAFELSQSASDAELQALCREHRSKGQA